MGARPSVGRAPPPPPLTLNSNPGYSILSRHQNSSCVFVAPIHRTRGLLASPSSFLLSSRSLVRMALCVKETHSSGGGCGGGVPGARLDVASKTNVVAVHLCCRPINGVARDDPRARNPEEQPQETRARPPLPAVEGAPTDLIQRFFSLQESRVGMYRRFHTGFEAHIAVGGSVVAEPLCTRCFFSAHLQLDFCLTSA